MYSYTPENIPFNCVRFGLDWVASLLWWSWILISILRCFSLWFWKEALKTVFKLKVKPANNYFFSVCIYFKGHTTDDKAHGWPPLQKYQLWLTSLIFYKKRAIFKHFFSIWDITYKRGCVAWSVTCLTTGVWLTAGLTVLDSKLSGRVFKHTSVTAFFAFAGILVCPQLWELSPVKCEKKNSLILTSACMPYYILSVQFQIVTKRSDNSRIRV